MVEMECGEPNAEMGVFYVRKSWGKGVNPDPEIGTTDFEGDDAVEVVPAFDLSAISSSSASASSSSFPRS